MQAVAGVDGRLPLHLRSREVCRVRDFERVVCYVPRVDAPNRAVFNSSEPFAGVLRPMNVHPPEDIAGPEPSPQPDQVEACEPARISIQAQIGADACKTILSVWGTLKARQETRTSV